ncbi:hypothetical protein OQA88_3482 [Cercophora sp. LCS_1]
MATAVPRVGVAAVVKSAEGKMVMGIRKGNAHGIGNWQFPGGHLEFGETPLQCAERETLEETGLVVKAEKVVAVTNDVFEESGKHYITLFVVCRRVDEGQEPETTEPEKCEGWFWRTWEDVKNLRDEDEGRLFLPIVNLMREYDVEAVL